MSRSAIHHPRSAAIDLQAEQAVSSDRLNWLRAGVLGANDGIVSTAGLVVGVAGRSHRSTL